jgi:hypothetical protein
MTALPSAGSLLRIPPYRLNEIGMCRKIKGDLNLKNLVDEREIIGPYGVAVEHLRIVLHRHVELEAKGLEVERLKKVYIDHLLSDSINDGENVADRGIGGAC